MASSSSSLQTLCDWDAKHGMGLDIALLSFASCVLLTNTFIETLPTFLTVMSTAAVVGLLIHLLVREFMPYCARGQDPPPSSSSSSPPAAASASSDAKADDATPATTSTTAATTNTNDDDATMTTTTTTAVASAPAAIASGALGFWGDLPGMQGRAVAKPRCARGYSNYIPVPET